MFSLFPRQRARVPRTDKEVYCGVHTLSLGPSAQQRSLCLKCFHFNYPRPWSSPLNVLFPSNIQLLNAANKIIFTQNTFFKVRSSRLRCGWARTSWSECPCSGSQEQHKCGHLKSVAHYSPSSDILALSTAFSSRNQHGVPHSLWEYQSPT